MVPDALHHLYPTYINPVASESMFANPVDKTWFMKIDDSACKKKTSTSNKHDLFLATSRCQFKAVLDSIQSVDLNRGYKANNSWIFANISCSTS
jgi:hypothetical protein